MVRPNNELGFSMADLYPNFGGVDTSTLATPESDDLDALNEDTKITEQAKTTEVSRKSVFLALAVMVALVVFFGGK